MTVRYDPRTEWAREDHHDAVARARRAVARALQPARVDLTRSAAPLLLDLAHLANTTELGGHSDDGRNHGQEVSW